MTKDERTLALMQLFEAVERGDLTLEACLQQNPAYRDDLIDLLKLTDAIQAISLPEPDPHFRSSARKRIITAMQVQEPVTFLAWFRHILQSAQLLYQRRPAMTLALIVALVFSLVGGSSVYASQQAIPGDLLYPLKMQIEDLQLSAAPEDLADNIYYQMAEERVEELLALIEQGRYQDIPAAMNRLEGALDNVSRLAETTPEQGRPETIAGLINSLAVLTERLDQVPDAAKPGLETAIEALQRAQDRLNENLPPQLPEQAGEGKPSAVPGGKPEGIPTVLPTQAQGGKPGTVPGGQSSSSPVPPTSAKPGSLPTAVPTNVPPVQPTVPPVEPPVQPPAQPTVPPVQPTVPPVEPPVQPPAQPTVPPVQPTVPPVEPPVQPPAQPTAPITPPVGRP